MASTRISANSGSCMLKTSEFSEAIEKPATNSEPYYVNIAGRDSIGSKSIRAREMWRMSQFRASPHMPPVGVRGNPGRIAEAGIHFIREGY